MEYDLKGKKFGRLTVLSRAKERPSAHDIYWLCKCDCGKEKMVTTGHLTAGTVKSCGCLRKEQAVSRFKEAAVDNIRHGEAGTPLYDVWHNMIQRCENPNAAGYKWYGKKGVKVCPEWHNFDSFSKWAHSHGYEDFSDAPRKDRLSIDRIDSNGDYCPENCRWITVSENTRRGAEMRWRNAAHTNRSTRTGNTV